MLLQTGMLAIVALGLAFFVLRPLIRAAEAQPLPADGEALAGPERMPPEIGLEGIGDYGAGEEDDDHISRLRAIFGDQKEDGANVLRAWLERDVQRMDAETEDAH
jgi:Flagellar biosynthesis/type III secretory pathway lipoprotein